MCHKLAKNSTVVAMKCMLRYRVHVKSSNPACTGLTCVKAVPKQGNRGIEVKEHNGKQNNETLRRTLLAWEEKMRFVVFRWTGKNEREKDW